MTATQTDSPTTSTETRTSEVFIRTNSEEKAMAEAAAEYYGCSQAEAGRQLYKAWFQDTFGDIDPELVADTTLDADDLQTLAAKDLSDDELHAELRRHTSTDESETTPTSYTATVVPAELKRSGPELDYEDLREAVQDPEDGGYWSDDLEIHPDRVGTSTLRANHFVTSRVLAAMARSLATNGSMTESDLRDLIEAYCLHLTDRLDKTRGRQYIMQTYENHVKRFLWPHPRPTNSLLFTTEERYYQALPGIMNDCEIALNDLAPVLIQTDKCMKTNQSLPMLETSPDTVETIHDWKSAVGEAMELVVTARNIGVQADRDTLYEIVDADEYQFTLRPDAEDQIEHILQTQKQFMQNFKEAIQLSRQKTILENHVEQEAKDRLTVE